MPNLTAKNMLLVAVLVLVVMAVWYLWGPSGGNLKSLDESNIAQFPAQFDSAAGSKRVVLLVSPT